MKIPNPNNPIFVQTNKGERDQNANICGSFNIDISKKPGFILPAQRLKQVINDADDAQLTTINAFAFYATSYWGVGDYIWDCGSTEITTGWAQDGITDSPSVSTTYADMVVYQDKLIVSSSTNLAKWASGDSAWDTDWYTAVCSGSTMQSSTPHPLAVVQIGSPILCIGDGQYLNTVVGTTATDPRLTLDSSQRIRWIVGGNSRAYIGCLNKDEDIGDSFVYEWDGGDTVPTRAYKLNAKGALSGVMYEDTLYIVATDGGVHRLSGNGFQLVAELPVFKSSSNPRGFDTSNLAAGFIGHKGMCVSKGKILINVNGGLKNGTTYDDELPQYTTSGVWELDPKTGSFVHKHAITMDKTGVVDFGQRIVPCETDQSVGAIFEARNTSASILVSGAYFSTSTGGAKAAIYVDDVDGSLDRRGRLITNKIFSNSLSNSWELSLKYGLMKSASDRMVVKYRVNDNGNLPFTAAVTWTDSDTFTSTDTGFANASVGDEVEVVSGDGGGCTAHITSITLVTTTYTIELSESITGVTGTETGKVRVHNFKYLDSFNDQVVGYKKYTIPTKSSSWIQVVVELRGDGGDSPVLEEIDIIPTKSQ